MAYPNRLRRSVSDKKLTGVAGGLAEYFDLDPVLVRLAFVLLAFAGGASVVLYIVLAIIMPVGEDSGGPLRVDREPEDVAGTESGETAEGKEGAEEYARGRRRYGEHDRHRGRGQREGARKLLALVLIVAGVFALLVNFGVLWWFSWGTFWPALLILIGAAVLIGRARRG